MIFKLSPILGSRSEVLETYLLEALHHLILIQDKEKEDEEYKRMERQIHFLSLKHSRPFQEQPKPSEKREREQFIESLFGESEEEKREQEQERKNTWRWSEETEAKIREMEAQKNDSDKE